MMGIRGDGCCAAARRGVHGAPAGGMRGAAATLGGVRAAAASVACGGGRRGVHQVVLQVLVEEEEEEEIYPNCQIICWIQLTTIILKTWPPFHTCPPHWTTSPWELWTYAWTELLQLVFLLEKLELMVGSSAHLPYFKGLILSCSKNKVFHVILLFWGIFSNILMLAGIEFCFRWSSGTQLVNISLE